MHINSQFLFTGGAETHATIDTASFSHRQMAVKHHSVHLVGLSEALE